MSESPNENHEAMSPLRRSVLTVLAGAISGIAIGTLWRVTRTVPEEIDIDELARQAFENQFGVKIGTPPKVAVFEEPESKEVVHSGMVMLFFSANWCAPCGPASTYLKEQEGFFRERGIKPFEFFEIMGEDSKEPGPLEIALKIFHKVDSLPSVLILSNGLLIKKFTGIAGDPETDVMKVREWMEGENINNAEFDKRP